MPNADSFSVTYSILATVEPGVAGSTMLRTRVAATARPVATAEGPVRCSSTGGLEKRLHDLIARRFELVPAGT